MHCNKLSIVSLCSNSGTSVRSPQTVFQLLIMTLLLLYRCNPAICRVNIGSWLQMSKMNCILDSLGFKGYSFLKQHYKQMMPAPLHSHPSVCGFHTIYAAFHLFKFRQEEITRVHDVNVPSFISNFMESLYVNLQFISCFCPFFYILINFFRHNHTIFLHSIKSKQYPQA